MNRIEKLISGLAFVIPCLMASTHANAFILKQALAGKVTIEVAGACAIPKTTVNAYLADIYTDADVLIGHGIVTTTGNLVALEESHSQLRYKNILATGAKSSIDSVDIVGDTLQAFLTANGSNCDIDTLQSTLNSKAAYQWSGAGGKVNYNAGFGGHVKKLCYSSSTQEYCTAEKFVGRVHFKGIWSNI